MKTEAHTKAKGKKLGADCGRVKGGVCSNIWNSYLQAGWRRSQQCNRRGIDSRGKIWDGESKDNDSYMSRVMCLISLGAERNESHTPHLSLHKQKGFALCQLWLITAQPPPFSGRDKWGTAVSRPRALQKVEFPRWRGLQHPKGLRGEGEERGAQ